MNGRGKFRFAGMAFAVPLLLALGAASASGKEFYKMSTIGPGTSPFIVSTTFAQMGKKYVGVEIQINATGAATRHAVDAARGKIDFFMSAPVVQHFMQNNLAMYKKLKEAPELAKKLRTVFNFPIGVYHMTVYEDSGIKSLMDIKGKRVFLGPPTGAARVVARAIVEGATGYKAGKDFTVVKLGWAAAGQAFQDRQLDLYINPTNVPSPIISQVALTNKIRFLGLSEADFKTKRIQGLMKLPGRTIETIPPKAYGRNQTNTTTVTSVGAWVGIGTHEGVPEEVVYKLTKAFFDHLDEVHAQAVWMKAISLENVFKELNIPVHPGARRYFEEKGLKVPNL